MDGDFGVRAADIDGRQAQRAGGYGQGTRGGCRRKADVGFGQNRGGN